MSESATRVPGAGGGWGIVSNERTCLAKAKLRRQIKTMLIRFISSSVPAHKMDQMLRTGENAIQLFFNIKQAA